MLLPLCEAEVSGYRSSHLRTPDHPAEDYWERLSPTENQNKRWERQSKPPGKMNSGILVIEVQSDELHPDMAPTTDRRTLKGEFNRNLKSHQRELARQD
jgi:hypothetical protein